MPNRLTHAFGIDYTRYDQPKETRPTQTVGEAPVIPCLALAGAYIYPFPTWVFLNLITVLTKISPLHTPEVPACRSTLPSNLDYPALQAFWEL